MDDLDIIKEFSDKNGKIDPHKTREKWLENHEEIRIYLENRFPDDEFISYKFSLQRIFNHVENLPVCEKCGKKIYKSDNQKHRWCSIQCQLTDENFIKWRSKNTDQESRAKKWKEVYNNKTAEEKQESINRQISTKVKKYGKNFGKEIYKRIEKTLKEKHGCRCIFELEEFREKSKKTKLLKYGNENFVNPEKTKRTIKERFNIDNWMRSPLFREKSKKTKLLKYGNENFVNPEKIKRTCIEHFGVDNFFKSSVYKEWLIENIESVREKAKSTCIEKLGVENPAQNEDVKEKAKLSRLKTSIEKYGYVSTSQIPEIKEKILETKRKNHSFNRSWPEENAYSVLINVFGENDVFRQYKSNDYPFACDFYIKPLDLYIELNFHWTHGGHPFDENNPQDVYKLNHWKSKNTKFYDKAIEVWTQRDPLKIKTARENNLNILFFYNIEEFNLWIENL